MEGQADFQEAGRVALHRDSSGRPPRRGRFGARPPPALIDACADAGTPTCAARWRARRRGRTLRGRPLSAPAARAGGRRNGRGGGEEERPVRRESRGPRRRAYLLGWLQETEDAARGECSQPRAVGFRRLLQRASVQPPKPHRYRTRARDVVRAFSRQRRYRRRRQARDRPTTPTISATSIGAGRQAGLETSSSLADDGAPPARRSWSRGTGTAGRRSRRSRTRSRSPRAPSRSWGSAPMRHCRRRRARIATARRGAPARAARSPAAAAAATALSISCTASRRAARS